MGELESPARLATFRALGLLVGAGIGLMLAPKAPAASCAGDIRERPGGAPAPRISATPGGRGSSVAIRATPPATRRTDPAVGPRRPTKNCSGPPTAPILRGGGFGHAPGDQETWAGRLLAAVAVTLAARPISRNISTRASWLGADESVLRARPSWRYNNAPTRSCGAEKRAPSRREGRGRCGSGPPARSSAWRALELGWGPASGGDRRSILGVEKAAP